MHNNSAMESNHINNVKNIIALLTILTDRVSLGGVDSCLAQIQWFMIFHIVWSQPSNMIQFHTILFLCFRHMSGHSYHLTYIMCIINAITFLLADYLLQDIVVPALWEPDCSGIGQLWIGTIVLSPNQHHHFSSLLRCLLLFEKIRFYLWTQRISFYFF